MNTLFEARNPGGVAPWYKAPFANFVITPMMLRLHGLYFRYRDDAPWVVDGIDLEFVLSGGKSINCTTN